MNTVIIVRIIECGKKQDVVSREVEWLWYPYISYTKIIIFEGDSGEGRTTLVLKLAADLSRGLTLPCDDDRVCEPK